MNSNNEVYFSASQIAKRWNTNISTVRRKLNKIAIRLGSKGSVVRYPASSVYQMEQNWKESH